MAEELTREYDGLFVHGMVADFTHHLDEIPAGDPRLVILLGSTIGNYRPAEAVELLQRIADLPGIEDRDLSSLEWILQGAAQALHDTGRKDRRAHGIAVETSDTGDG